MNATYFLGVGMSDANLSRSVSPKPATLAAGLRDTTMNMPHEDTSIDEEPDSDSELLYIVFGFKLDRPFWEQ